MKKTTYRDMTFVPVQVRKGELMYRLVYCEVRAGRKMTKTMFNDAKLLTAKEVQRRGYSIEHINDVYFFNRSRQPY